MQVMPDTGARYGVAGDRKRTLEQKLLDPDINVRIGTMYLRDLLALFADDLELALAAYNAGEQAVVHYANRIPPYPETREYVKLVQQFYELYRPPPASAKPARIRVPSREIRPEREGPRAGASERVGDRVDAKRQHGDVEDERRARRAPASSGASPARSPGRRTPATSCRRRTSSRRSRCNRDRRSPGNFSPPAFFRRCLLVEVVAARVVKCEHGLDHEPGRRSARRSSASRCHALDQKREIA